LFCSIFGIERRFEKARGGRALYGAEELIAELGTAFLSAEFGFDNDLRHAGYIGHWIELLKADKRAFFTACSQASKAADYLRGLALGAPMETAARQHPANGMNPFLGPPSYSAYRDATKSRPEHRREGPPNWA
jgi:antirestriction protein ArdC